MNHTQLTPAQAAQAVLALVKTDPEQCQKLCAALVQAAPNHPETLHALGVVRRELGRPAEGILLLMQAAFWLECQPKNAQRDTLLARWLVDVGLACNAAGRLAEAVGHWQRSLALEKSDDVARWVQTGRAKLIAAWTEQAEGTIRPEVAATPPLKSTPTPETVRTLTSQADAALRAGDPARCEALCIQILHHKKQSLEALHLLSLATSRQGRHTEARKLIQEVLRRAPRSAIFWNTAGLIFAAEQPASEEAERAYRKSLALDKTYINPLINLGCLLIAQNREEEAQTCYTRARNLHPGQAAVYRAFSGAWHEQGMQEAGLSVVDAGLDIAPDDPDLLCNRGVILNALGRYAQAEDAYRAALTVRPDSAPLWMNLGNALEASNRVEAALQAFEHSLELAPESPVALINYGNLLHRLGRYVDCTQVYRQAVTIEPTNLKARGNLANMLFKLGNKEEAIRQYRLVLEQNPHFLQALCCLGSILQSVDPHESAALYERALAQNPESPEALSGLALARLDQGTPAAVAEAETLIERTLQLHPNFHPAWMTKFCVQFHTSSFRETLPAVHRALELLWDSFRAVDTADSLNLFTDSSGPAMSVSRASDALLCVKRFLDELGVSWRLDSGTLLGLVRDGELLPHDKDMDISMPWDVDRDWLIAQVQRSKEFLFINNTIPDAEKRLWNMAIVHRESNIATDFFFRKPEGASVLMGFHHAVHPVLWRFSEEGESRLTYRGESFPIPLHPERFFEEHYGPNWRTPDTCFDAVISAFNLAPESSDVSLHIGYSRLYDKLAERAFAKAHGYCTQLLRRVEDPFLERLACWLQQHTR